MYERFYGLRERPFDLTPNPRYLFLTGRHREALSNLQYGIASRRGVTLLIGEAGTGKTTLVHAVLESEQQKNARFVYLKNPMLTRAELVEFLARGFGLSDRAAVSKTALLLELEQQLIERQGQGMTTALIVDEAQALSFELLEEIRLLANIETATEKLLPVVLAGQPQLADMLNAQELRQLKQRVALRCDLRSLDLKETAAYIAGRIRVAGSDGTQLFSKEAVELIHVCSCGIPRTISVICDNALVSGFAAGRRVVGASIVYEVCKDFDLNPPPRHEVRPQPAQAAVARSVAAAVPRGARIEPAPIAREANAVEAASPRALFSLFSKPRLFF